MSKLTPENIRKDILKLRYENDEKVFTNDWINDKLEYVYQEFINKIKKYKINNHYNFIYEDFKINIDLNKDDIEKINNTCTSENIQQLLYKIINNNFIFLTICQTLKELNIDIFNNVDTLSDNTGKLISIQLKFEFNTHISL
jgi:hypothetical protein